MKIGAINQASYSRIVDNIIFLINNQQISQTEIIL